MKRHCARLVRRQIEAGINFLVPCGTTGESPTLTRAEHLRVVEITLEEAKGKVPVLAGAGGYNTHEVIELAREIEAMGADGMLSVTPYYNKPTQEGLYQHYQAIAAAIRLPIVRVQRAGAHRRERRARHAGAPGQDRKHRRRERSLAATSGRWPPCCTRCPSDFIVLSGDDAITIPLMRARRTRHHFGGVQRDSRRDDGHRAGLPARRFRRRARACSANTCR